MHWCCTIFGSVACLRGTASPPSGFVFTFFNPIVTLVVEVFVSEEEEFLFVKNFYMLGSFFENGRPRLLLRTMVSYIFDTIDVGCLLTCRPGGGPM